MRLRSAGFAAILFVMLFAMMLAMSGCGKGGGKADPEPDPGEVVALDAEGAVEVSLDYAAGTGYEWVCTVEPEGVLSIQSQDTVDMTEGDEPIDGGPLRDYVMLRAAGPGKATLTCNLERSWEEGKPAETQTFVFDVNEDLQIQFLEDESDFVNPPERVYNS